jgi:KUP system potassium uptake protein
VYLMNRLELERVFEDFWHLTVHYGFVEIPDLPSTLRAAKDLGCPVDLDNAVYFGAHDEVFRGKTVGLLLRWRLPLFAFLFRNSVRAVDLFNLPSSNFLEMGRQIEINRGPRPWRADEDRFGNYSDAPLELRWNIEPASSPKTASYRLI